MRFANYLGSCAQRRMPLLLGRTCVPEVFSSSADISITSIAALFLAERVRGLDAGGSPRRKIRCQDCDSQDRDRHDEVNPWFVNVQIKEQGAEDFRQRQREQESNC